MAEASGGTWRDALAPLLILGIGVLEALTAGQPDAEVVLAFELGACALLVLRRRWSLVVAPAAMLLVVLSSFVGPAADELATPILVIVLAGFSLGRWPPDLRGLTLLLPVYLVALLLVQRSDGQPSDVTDAVFMAALIFPPYVFGLVMRTLDDRNARLAQQAESLKRLQETVRQDAVAAERARIARELHDVLAHSISAMVVQASAGHELVRVDPDRAATAMREVADTGRRALAETGRLLSLVRDSDGELGLEPDPGLDRLDELVDQFRRSGLSVALAVEGPLGGLPAGVDLSAYRVVQECLTNALKYGEGRSVRLHIRRDARELCIEAENRCAEARSTGSGLGLVGMAERVSVFGGRLEHERTRDGRFRLSAVLPLEMADV